MMDACMRRAGVHLTVLLCITQCTFVQAWYVFAVLAFPFHLRKLNSILKVTCRLWRESCGFTVVSDFVSDFEHWESRGKDTRLDGKLFLLLCGSLLCWCNWMAWSLFDLRCKYGSFVSGIEGR